MNALAGTGGLVRLVLRRDRIVLPLWVLFLGLVPISYVASIDGLFPTAAGRASYAAASAHNAGFVALYGPLYGSSLGELVSWRAGFLPIVVGLVAILTVVRHTRTEEDTGRRELLSATVVGRHAGLAAALLTTCGATLVLGAVLAAGMVGQGLPAAGSLAFGAELAVAGWLFAGVAGVAAQLAGGAGAARGLAVGTLGVAYVLRVVGDVSGITHGALSWVSWVSPLGWLSRIHAYSGERWWVLALAVGVAAGLALAAVVLSAHRDVGAGLLPPRLGRAAAGPSLRSPLGLAWRLHRGLLVSWAAAFAALGVVLGYLAADVGDLVRDSPQMRDVFARLGGASGLVDDYLSGMIGFLGLVAAGYSIQAALRVRDEEGAGRAEPVLATAVGRLRWVGSHLLFALLGPAAALAAMGVAMGLTHGLNSHDVAGQLPGILAGAMIQLPAVWVLGAVAVALLGLLPRYGVLAWGGLAVCLLFGLVGGALDLNHWIVDVSPFTHLPHLPGGTVHTAPLVWLLAVTAALTAVGLARLRRRDIPTA